ncbi:hypothetical protein HMPREF3086_01610 [Dietzia sp. HMSC21D01]|nr:hypothetical protein HMPREF3086_01610 [Dietzia sp. HMSC21D01]
MIVVDEQFLGDNFDCDVDLVLCIDVTASMKSLLSRVKENAARFDSDLREELQAQNRIVRNLRVRVLAFRDYYYDAVPMNDSGFFDLASQSADYAAFLDSLVAQGGGDAPENGLEALALALQSKWKVETTKSRQVIVLWTDTSAHPLEKAAADRPDNYPSGLPASFDELTDLWDQLPRHETKRLLIYAPSESPWPAIGENWDQALHYPAKAGDGLQDYEYEQILKLLAASVAGA